MTPFNIERMNNELTTALTALEILSNSLKGFMKIINNNTPNTEFHKEEKVKRMLLRVLSDNYRANTGKEFLMETSKEHNLFEYIVNTCVNSNISIDIPLKVSPDISIYDYLKKIDFVPSIPEY